eukprot:2832171-Alexandrium_andersonii.AAC.1
MRSGTAHACDLGLGLQTSSAQEWPRARAATTPDHAIRDRQALLRSGPGNVARDRSDPDRT